MSKGASKVVRVFVWSRLAEEEVQHEVWLENVSDDRMVKIFEGEKDAVIAYAKSINWTLGAGPLRIRDTVEHGHLRKGHLAEFRLRRMPGRALNSGRKRLREKSSDAHGLLQES